MLYITSQGLTCFLTGSFYLLIPLTHFTYSAHPTSPPPTATNLFSVSYACVCVCFGFHVRVQSYNFFFIWLTSFSIMSSDLFANDRLSYFLWLNDISLCVYLIHAYKYSEVGFMDHMVVFSILIFLRILSTVFHSGWTSLYSQHCTRVFFSLCLYQHLLFLIFLRKAILVGLCDSSLVFFFCHFTYLPFFI